MCSWHAGACRASSHVKIALAPPRQDEEKRREAELAAAELEAQAKQRLLEITQRCARAALVCDRISAFTSYSAAQA